MPAGQLNGLTSPGAQGRLVNTGRPGAKHQPRLATRPRGRPGHRRALGVLLAAGLGRRHRRREEQQADAQPLRPGVVDERAQRLAGELPLRLHAAQLVHRVRGVDQQQQIQRHLLGPVHVGAAGGGGRWRGRGAAGAGIGQDQPGTAGARRASSAAGAAAGRTRPGRAGRAGVAADLGRLARGHSQHARGEQQRCGTHAGPGARAEPEHGRRIHPTQGPGGGASRPQAAGRKGRYCSSRPGRM